MIDTFSDLISQFTFFIPCYQRAYSWTDKQLALFTADLAEYASQSNMAPQYYLGHYIFERDNDTSTSLAVVDGQQRLTTIAIFSAVCQSLKASSTPLLPLRLAVVEYDADQFTKLLSPASLATFKETHDGGTKEDTASLERVAQAILFFLDAFSPATKKPHGTALAPENIDLYLAVLNRAAISVGIYKSKAVASQIFELHNTRGVLLTETDKLKALLMRYVYSNSDQADCDVANIEGFFATVFKFEEQAACASFRGEMLLDDILAHHLRAIDDGTPKTDFKRPETVEGQNGCLSYVRERLNSFTSKQSGISYAKALAREFATSMSLISTSFVEQDNREPLIGDVILLDQRRSMIFLLRYFRSLLVGQSVDTLLLKRWEAFLFLWDCHDAFFNMKAGKKDSFPAIYEPLLFNADQVVDLLGDYYSGRTPFAYRPFEVRSRRPDGTETTLFGLLQVFSDYITLRREDLLCRAYNWGHWHPRYKYWLYKYEIASACSDDQSRVRESMRALFKQNEVTLDHIVPHELQWRELSNGSAQDDDIDHWPDRKDAEQARANWNKILTFIDGVGNLLLLSRSNNASLQNIAPFRRASEYAKCHLDSESYRDVGNWTDPLEWCFHMERRGVRLLEWMRVYFTSDATWAATS